VIFATTADPFLQKAIEVPSCLAIGLLAIASVERLDISHVATAQDLEADTLASFDIRQRKLAASVGLKLLPALLQ
jgi:hypothetical protein